MKWRGFIWDDLRKIFTEGSQMAKIPNGIKTLPKISIAWAYSGVWTNVTDERNRRQTTDGRTTTYSEHEHEFTFAKNCTSGTVQCTLHTGLETFKLTYCLLIGIRLRSSHEVKSSCLGFTADVSNITLDVMLYLCLIVSLWNERGFHIDRWGSEHVWRTVWPYYRVRQS